MAFPILSLSLPRWQYVTEAWPRGEGMHPGVRPRGNAHGDSSFLKAHFIVRFESTVKTNLQQKQRDARHWNDFIRLPIESISPKAMQKRARAVSMACHAIRTGPEPFAPILRRIA